jgi:hypothetical protein
MYLTENNLRMQKFTVCAQQIQTNQQLLLLFVVYVVVVVASQIYQ